MAEFPVRLEGRDEGRELRVVEDDRTDLGLGDAERVVGRIDGPDEGRDDDRPTLEDPPFELGFEGRLFEGRLAELRVPPFTPPELALPFP